MEPTLEFALDNQILVLDGRAVDVFTKQGSSMRFHVDHLAVEGKEKKDHLHLTIGIEAFGSVMNGTTLKVPLERQQEALAFFAAAKERRGA